MVNVLLLIILCFFNFGAKIRGKEHEAATAGDSPDRVL
jgi:hypothetical protein